MRRILWAIARKSFSRGARLKTQMSKATLVFSLLFIACFVFYLFSAFFPSDSMHSSSQNSAPVLIVNPPASFSSFVNSEDSKISVNLSSMFILGYDPAYYDFTKYQTKLDIGSISAAVVFPEDFDAQMASLTDVSRPQIISYYNPADENSVDAHYFMIKSFLPDYGFFLQEQNGRIASQSDYYHVISSELTSSRAVSDSREMQSIAAHMILPFLLFVAIMYAAMESGVSSIAGEKERGTFAAILLTPVRRSEIVLGSALGILLYSMIPAVILIFLLLPPLGLFTLSAVLYLIVICLSLALLLTSLILILSALNRTILSAQSSFLPVFFLMLIVCITAMQQKDIPGYIYYFLPFYGHYYGITAVLEGRYSLVRLFELTAGSMTLSVLMLLIVEKLLHVERFTTYAEAEFNVKKDLRRRIKADALRAKAAAHPQNIVYGYHPLKHRSSYRLLTLQLGLPSLLLAVFQPLALIFPFLLYLRTSESTVFLNRFANASSGVSITSAAQSVFQLLSDLMQSRFFILSMSGSYVCIILVYIFIVRRIEKLPLATAGLPVQGPRAGQKALRNYARGLLIGFGMMLGVYSLLYLTGQIRVDGFGLNAAGLPLFGAYVLMWIPQGATEELMLRGYMLPRLSAKFGRVAAVAVTSLVFSFLHIGNAGFSGIACMNLILIAVFFSLMALSTQQIWTVCAAHTIWNFAQGNLLGLQVSGSVSAARLVHTRFTGNSLHLLTGGAFGPEGGLAVTAVVVISLLILLFVRPKLGKAVST